MSYEVLFSRRRLPAATYIFTDFDRLDFWALEIAAGIYRQLDGAGCRVLNDPARGLTRLRFLQQMHMLGLNRYQVWSAHDAKRVDRYPVFLRTIRAHRGVLSAVLSDPEELAQDLSKLVSLGFPLSDLMVVEYCAEPAREGMFRKPSVYRVGDRTIAVPSVHQRQWAVNLGTARLATEDDYTFDLQTIQNNPYGDVARKAFDVAELEYGRADVGVVGGTTQIYEINTNPTMPPMTVQHHSAQRIEAYRVSTQAYLGALAELDSARSKQRIAISPPATRPWKHHARWWWPSPPFFQRRFVLKTP